VGFDWPRVEEVVAKVEEELAEVKEELARHSGEGPGHARLAAELGDLLFAVANLARFVKVDPERELRATVHRFRRRFQHIEDELARRDSHPTRATLAEMDALWEEAKQREEKPE
jgi:uncharacterized protein YabN with tetrapyrrole methylase and pyrophosphatase domain